MMYYHINKSDLTIISGPHEANCTYTRKLTSCGNPDMIELSQYDLVPGVRALLTETQKHGPPVIYVDRVEIPAVEKTAEELRAELVPQSISPRQCRIVLRRNNLLDIVNATVSAIGGEALDEWEYATEIRRDNQLVAQVSSNAGMTEAQVDAMFIEAATL